MSITLFFLLSIPLPIHSQGSKQTEQPGRPLRPKDSLDDIETARKARLRHEIEYKKKLAEINELKDREKNLKQSIAARIRYREEYLKTVRGISEKERVKQISLLNKEIG